MKLWVVYGIIAAVAYGVSAIPLKYAMSSKFLATPFHVRNDTIDPYPPALRKILCISKKEFKRIKVLVGRRPKRKRKGLAPSLKNKKQSRVKIFDKRKGQLYEATNIAQAYDSTYWSWRRVNDWFKEYRDDYTMS